MRAIFLFLIVIIVFLLIMTIIRGRQERKFAKEQQEQQEKNRKDTAQKMISCEVCHAYLPEKDAICRDGKCFCGEEHLRQYENG
ncbi:PP0621 family protein [Thiomicrorhabdus xiamenensis]|uniref:Uncharacterized protein n=1 Tax=Thiomicrorhabdus xiamenensis TaxID=2739063 RepID=A0A7D4SNC8_9GAMM|nr:PP0621 family protein [Thiomicrorhabdus xiamenensis]QKI89361.1 hypothetical protein HQN79_07175 [Thiomicrorhabdus xiamenensis]